jgi:hypothetical protein
MFLDFNAMIAQEAQANPSKTLRTYVDIKGVKHTVEHFSNDMFAIVREDGHYTTTPCNSLVMTFTLANQYGLVEEGQIVVAQAQAVVALDDEIKALEEKLAQVKAEKQAIVDAVEIKTSTMHVNGFTVDVHVHARGFTEIQVSQKVSRGCKVGFHMFTHSTVGKKDYIKLLAAIKRATSMQGLIDSLKDEGIVWFVTLSADQCGVSVSMDKDCVYVQGHDIEASYHNPINIVSVTRALDWMTDCMLGLYEDLCLDCDNTSKQDVYDLCQMAQDCGATEIIEEVEEYDDHENGWKIWE